MEMILDHEIMSNKGDKETEKACVMKKVTICENIYNSGLKIIIL
jgi:hypothetical protein